MSAPLEVKSVCKSFGAHQVLDDISFELKEGEIFGLIGLNGAGKTTLIKIMLDLLKADQGETLLFGQPSQEEKSREKLCYLPEKFQPSRYLKGKEFLNLALSYYGQKLDLDTAREQASMFDLRQEMLDERVGKYSKGMGQKLGLLSAFLLKPPFMVLDEPMSGLDPSARIKLKRMLLDARKDGATIFFSSHILSDIDEICDRIGIIHNGRLLFVGTPKSFKSKFKAASLEESFLLAIGEDDKKQAA